MTFPYTPGIPNPPNNPSADVGIMQSNATSIGNIMAVDHFGFNNSSGGKHQQSTYPSFPTSPPGAPTTVAGVGAVFVQTDSAGQQALWFIRDGFAGSKVQLTTSKILAPSVTVSGVSPFTQGVTFLAGGLLLQFGSITILANPSITTISFPVAFPNNVLNVLVTRQHSSSGSTTAQEIFVVAGSVALIGFQVATSSSASDNICYWQAIGN